MTRQFRRGKKASLTFYRAKLSFKARTFNKIFPLDPYFGEMIGDKKEVYIADLGAGMFSTTGSTWEGVKVHLYPSDILADDFNAMLVAHHVLPEIPVEKQDMLNLTYPDNFFDIVHCVNALDHCEDPHKAIEEMERVCAPGGWIYLKHWKNVGEFENYRGFHQWNICKVHDALLFWNQTDNFSLAGWQIVEQVEPGNTPDTLVIAKYQKPL